MSFNVRVLLVAVAIATCLVLAAFALAAETLTFEAHFAPDKLGASTNVSADGRFRSTTAGPPAPVTNVTAYLPAGMELNVHGAGVCSVAALERAGPSACPADSRAGFGGGTGVLELAGELIHEPYTLDFFLGPREGARNVVLAYVHAGSPAAFELVLVAHEIAAPQPYGIGFTVAVPPIATLPGASDASVESAFLTFGARGVAYYAHVHGRHVLEHVKGLVVPRRCPRGGFPLKGVVDFADATETVATALVSCPR
jgi:hypothetical protein